MSVGHNASVNIAISVVLLPYVEPALARMRYLYPDLEFAPTESTIEVSCATGELPPAIKREIQYTLYREKIYAETFVLRRALVEAVTRR